MLHDPTHILSGVSACIYTVVTEGGLQPFWGAHYLEGQPACLAPHDEARGAVEHQAHAALGQVLHHQYDQLQQGTQQGVLEKKWSRMGDLVGGMPAAAASTNSCGCVVESGWCSSHQLGLGCKHAWLSALAARQVSRLVAAAGGGEGICLPRASLPSHMHAHMLGSAQCRAAFCTHSSCAQPGRGQEVTKQ
jgi:hypothetical protein